MEKINFIPKNNISEYLNDVINIRVYEDIFTPNVRALYKESNQEDKFLLYVGMSIKNKDSLSDTEFISLIRKTDKKEIFDRFSLDYFNQMYENYTFFMNNYENYFDVQKYFDERYNEEFLLVCELIKLKKIRLPENGKYLLNKMYSEKLVFDNETANNIKKQVEINNQLAIIINSIIESSDSKAKLLKLINIKFDLVNSSKFTAFDKDELLKKTNSEINRLEKLNQLNLLVDDYQTNAISNTSKLKNILIEHGFMDLELVKELTPHCQNKLFNLIYENKLPYRIAMLDYLAYIKHLRIHYFKSGRELEKKLAEWLNSNERTIRGNKSTLTTLKADKNKRYTSYLHIKKVRNDYQLLK